MGNIFKKRYFYFENLKKNSPCKFFLPQILIIYIFFQFFYSIPFLFAADELSARLDKNSFKASGTNETLLTVDKFGRYSIKIKSNSGSALQIVNKMSGPCEMSGEINKKDGRIDTLLDNGTYKIITYSDPASTGDLILSVNDFKELNQPIPIIKKYKLYEKELNDYEKISYWFKIDTKTTVYFDAIGRSLKDLRIWFEGNWLIDHDLYSETIENSSGKPMIYCRLVAVLNPGYYLLTAYSGEPLKWANEDNKYPFYIRYGIPKINETDMFKDTVSPFGFNHYLITSNSVVGTNYFHLMLNERKEFELKISQCDNPGRSSLNFEVLLGNNKITNKSKDPECEININSGYHNIIVTVIGPPGENFVLQNFSKSHFPYKFFGAGGKYWISTIHSGYFEDNIDISGFLVRINIRQSQIEYSKPIATNVLTLDKDKPWSRHINLLDDNKIVFNIPEDGEYQVTTSGAKALCKFEPYFINLPAGYRTPDFVPANQSFLLLKGYNLLSIKPMKKGILDITVSKVEQKDIQSFKNRITGFLGDLVPDILKSKPQFISSDEMTESSNNNFKGNFQIPGIELYYNDQFTLFLHDQASRNIGVIIRPHALNLAESLPVVLASGEIISFPFYLNENSKLNIKSLKESEVICNIDNKLFENQELNTGHHIIELKNNSKKTDVFFVKSYPVENDITFYLPDNIVTNFSQFQTIEDKAPAFFDLGYNDKKTILFNVSAPGLYKFESLGRLKTNCFIRTRIVTNLFSASENGIGNNFLLNQYLKDGEYQITFGTLEKSSGHMGIKLTKTEIINGGQIDLNEKYKASVPAGSAILYNFIIKAPGNYQLITSGQGKYFTCRLEDKDGWPIEKINTPSNISRYFFPGEYHYLILPAEVETVRITTLNRILEKEEIKGRGPHKLTINEPIKNTWIESPSDKPREKDIYEFEITAPVNAKISINNDMQGLLTLKTNDKEYKIIDKLYYKNIWSGILDIGSYRILLENSRKNNYLKYELKVETNELMPGLDKTINVPGKFDLNVGKRSLLEIYSDGNIDCKGTLTSYENNDLKIINDDIPDDWNFGISTLLDEGKYKLKITPVGNNKTGNNFTKIIFKELNEKTNNTIANFPYKLNFKPGDKVNIFPIKINDIDILSIKIKSNSFLGCILEKGSRIFFVILWKACFVDIPLEKGDYNLKIWSIDHQPYNAVLELSNIIADLINYKDLKNFEKIKSILKNNYLIAKIKVDEPGIYEFFGERNIYYSNKYGFNFVSSNNKINVLNNYFWVFYRPSKNNIYFSKFIFDGNFYNTTSVNIYGENPVLLDIKSNKIGPTVTISSTKYNQIMSGFVTGEDKNSLNVLPEVFISSSNIFDNNKCLSIALPGKANKLMLWNPEENSKDITFNTNIELYYFKKPLIENNINFGKFSDKIKGLSQIKYNLPKGNKSIEFVLRKNMIAYTFDEDSIKDIFWARDDYNSFYLETNLDKFIILNLYNSISAYEITVLNKQKISTSMLISQESMFEKIYQDSGEININIDGKINDNKLLNITGNISECILINKNGKIHKIINEKPFILLNEISYLKIKYNPGLVKVWISEKDNILEKRWGKDSALNKIQLENFSLNLPPANNNSYEFTVNTPSMVYVSSQEPYVVAMQKDGAYLVCNEILSGSFNYFLSVQGNYQLKLRSINDKQFQDEIEFSIVPIIEITDTLGPETIIEKNESKAFSFIHKQKGYIGIAVKAFKDILNCEVYSNDQKLIKSGRLLYLNLDAGQYFLKVVPNNDNEPLKFKPVIAGIVEQPSSPPKEYIKEFFEKYGIK